MKRKSDPSKKSQLNIKACSENKALVIHYYYHFLRCSTLKSQLCVGAAPEDITIDPVEYWKYQQNIASVYGVRENVYYAINVTVHLTINLSGKSQHKSMLQGAKRLIDTSFTLSTANGRQWNFEA